MEISLLSLIPKTSQNKYFYQNGLSRLIPRLSLKVHSNIEECEYLWDMFSPKKSLFDSWNFRYSWYEGYNHKPFFYTLYEGTTPLALLPLCLSYREDGKKRYEWFGTNWMEDNTFFVKEEHFIDLLYAVFPTPIHLNAIEKTSDWTKMPIDAELKPDDPKNIKYLDGYQSMEDLLSTFKKKSRYHLKFDYQYVKSLRPRIVVTNKPDMNLMNKMIQMNIDQFSAKAGDESDLTVPKRAKTYQQMVKNSGRDYTVKFIEIYIQDRLAGIDFIIEYKNRYYTVKGGIDVNRFQGISNYMVYVEFEDALKNGYKLVDCLQIDYGWKHRYFDQYPTYIFEK